MSRKQPKPPSAPSKAYLVSFGDTMTALLAFFIVLNSLAKDQTGANLYAGTGSFVQAIKSLGLPGQMSGKQSSKVVTQETPAPIYAVAENQQERTKGRGPDDEDDNLRVINREAENFQRFLNEIDYKFKVNERPATTSQIVFDSFERLDRKTAELGDDALRIASESIPLLSRDNYRLEVVVWAPMPGPTVIKNTMKRAKQIQDQLEQLFSFTEDQRRRFTTSAKPWLFVDAKRPVVSFILSRTDE